MELASRGRIVKAAMLLLLQNSTPGMLGPVLQAALAGMSDETIEKAVNEFLYVLTESGYFDADESIAEK